MYRWVVLNPKDYSISSQFLSIESWYLVSKKCKSLNKIGARHLKIVLFWHNIEDINALQCDINTQCYIKIGII